ncbi:uncharacterized protein LOC128202713 [Mya arenaria]|uniref:uncharacterized protein LOC128202713 n=1 Tax=Mya arenaria TaxID=6604 RepID=UPI0022E2149C|nr:uncharacterized protein LOC128202713 [Mya arenaria]XP_052759746.1 uncharacterized protein LOC128202713 [Mya arenaria]
MLEDTQRPSEQKGSVQRVGEFMLRQAKVFFGSFRGKSFREQMKTKNFYVLVLFILATLTTLYILVDPSPNLHTIVTETHRQISNIHIPTNIRQTKKELLEVDKKYLDILDFPYSTIKPPLTVVPKNVTRAVRAKRLLDAEVLAKDPVIVVPLLSGCYDEAVRFLNSVKKYVPKKLVVFYDLGISGKENTMLSKACNGSVYNCEVKTFVFNRYPSHVRSNSLGAYVPLLLQESLNSYHAVIWSNPQEYFINGMQSIAGVISKAREIGIVAWSIKDTTSSITYFKMYTFFDVKKEQYYFHRAVKTSHLVVFNTEKVRTKIMLPWIKCALVEECISPTGSQNSGGYCSEKRPRYLYSGCHHYEQSALNLILGKEFSFVETPYIANEEIFGVESTNKSVTSSIMVTKEDDAQTIS